MNHTVAEKGPLSGIVAFWEGSRITQMYLTSHWTIEFKKKIISVTLLAIVLFMSSPVFIAYLCSPIGSTWLC